MDMGSNDKDGDWLFQWEIEQLDSALQPARKERGAEDVFTSPSSMMPSHQYLPPIITNSSTPHEFGSRSRSHVSTANNFLTKRCYQLKVLIWFLVVQFGNLTQLYHIYHHHHLEPFRSTNLHIFTLLSCPFQHATIFMPSIGHHYLSLSFSLSFSLVVLVWHLVYKWSHWPMM